MVALLLAILMQTLTIKIKCDLLWDHNFSDQNGMSESGNVALSCGIIVFNPCPDPTLVVNCCTNIHDGSRTWTTNAISTVGYNHITFQFGMNIKSIESGESCKLYYSIDDSQNWLLLHAYTTESKKTHTFNLPTDADDNIGIRVMFELDAEGSNDQCYLNSGYIRGDPMTNDPTNAPTNVPTPAPTKQPTPAPTYYPTDSPTATPSSAPTIIPTPAPTIDPTSAPSSSPTIAPTKSPFVAGDPTRSPTSPTNEPTKYPSYIPTVDPTNDPTTDPTIDPTHNPSYIPTNNPSYIPTVNPTNQPTYIPTSSPTFEPTIEPTDFPTENPIHEPTIEPTSRPSANPTVTPTSKPSKLPTKSPTTTSGGSSGEIGETTSEPNTKKIYEDPISFLDANKFLLILITGALLICCCTCWLLIARKNRKKKAKLHQANVGIEMQRIKSVESQTNGTNITIASDSDGAPTTTTTSTTQAEAEHDHEPEKKNDLYMPFDNDMTVKMWLENIGLVEYYDLFINHGFADSTDAILDLNNNDLREMGINKIGHRKMLLKQIQKNNLEMAQIDVDEVNGDTKGMNSEGEKDVTDDSEADGSGDELFVQMNPTTNAPQKKQASVAMAIMTVSNVNYDDNNEQLYETPAQIVPMTPVDDENAYDDNEENLENMYQKPLNNKTKTGDNDI